MMQLKINKTGFRALLILAALFVWFHNGYKFFIGVQKSDEVMLKKSGFEDNMVAQDSTDFEKGWTYEATFRDPFENRLLKRKPAAKHHAVTKPKKQKPVKETLQPPLVKLQGIIRDAKGILAILESNSETRFVRAGDNVFDIKIVAIDSTVLSYEFNKAQFVLNLQ